MLAWKSQWGGVISVRDEHIFLAVMTEPRGVQIKLAKRYDICPSRVREIVKRVAKGLGYPGKLERRWMGPLQVWWENKHD